jgi:hypothetical protein
MKINIFLPLLLAALCITGLQAQFYHQDVNYDTPVFNPETHNKASCEINGNQVVTVAAVRESPSPTAPFDGLLTVHDGTGMITHSYRFGTPGLDERFTAVIQSVKSPTEVMVVGYAEDAVSGEHMMLVMRIEVLSGIVLCQTTIRGEPGNSWEGTGIASFDGDTERYIVIGLAFNLTTVSGDPVAAHIVPGCKVEWSKRYYNRNPGGRLDHIVPNNVLRVPGRRGFEFVMVGTYWHSSIALIQQSADAFLFQINSNGDITQGLVSYGLLGFRDFGVDIARLPNGNYGLLFNSYDNNPLPVPLLPNRISLAMVDPSFFLLSPQADTYFDPDKSEIMGTGLQLSYDPTDHPSGFAISTIGVHSLSTTIFRDLGFISRGLFSPAASYHELTQNRNYLSASLIESTSGFVMKATYGTGNATGTYGLLALDPLGRNNAICENDGNLITGSNAVLEATVDMVQIGHNRVARANLLGPFWRPGKLADCNGVEFASFRTASSPATAKQAKASIYPSLVSEAHTHIQFEYQATEHQQISLSVYDALGKKCFERSYEAAEGNNHFSIHTSALAQGINLITVSSAKGESILQQKLLRK